MKRMVNGEIIEMTAEEIAVRQAEEQAWNDGAFDRAMANLRQNRNRKLAETDFYALSDVTMSEDMTTYRQNLRDITDGLSTVEDVNNITWPTKP